MGLLVIAGGISRLPVIGRDELIVLGFFSLHHQVTSLGFFCASMEAMDSSMKVVDS